MQKCKNSECSKEISNNLAYCNENCLQKHKEQKKKNEEINSIFKQNFNLKNEEDIWFGQGRRKRAMDTIMKIAKELCPISLKKFVCITSFRTGLSLCKISDDYLQILLEVEFLTRNNNTLKISGTQGGQKNAP
jgi:hypothetical protein